MFPELQPWLQRADNGGATSQRRPAQELLLAFAASATRALETGRFPAVGGTPAASAPPLPPPQQLRRQSSAERAKAEGNMFTSSEADADGDVGPRTTVGTRIGIDVGGVIIARCVLHGCPGLSLRSCSPAGAVARSRVRGPGGPDTSFFGPNFLATPAVEGAIDAVQACVRTFGADNVFIVSKAAGEVAHKTLAWFDHHGVFQRTGDPPPTTALRHTGMVCCPG